LAPPAICKYLPRQSGQDNEGIGFTKHGERYLLKSAPSVCIAEFIGAALCRACGVPTPEPTIVEFKGRKIFGSRLESGVGPLPKIQLDVIEQVKNCANASIFSAVLAIDIALGNTDRHWHNWLPQAQNDGTILMRAMDFSRAWPTAHPPLAFAAMRSENTEICWRSWFAYGIKYDEPSAFEALDALDKLTSTWLSSIFEQLPTEWIASASGPELLRWWEDHWKNRVAEAKQFLSLGAWT
jgi:hypothetical protein